MTLAYEFSFNGGVKKPTPHTSEKFLMFFVIGGREIPLYQMLRDSLVVKMIDTEWAGGHGMTIAPQKEEWKFATSNNVVKVFVGQAGFGVPTRYYSFYLRLMEDAGPLVTIKPFTVNSTGMFFMARAKFLSNKQAVALLDEENESRKFVVRQGMLPLSLLQQMVAIDRNYMKDGVRRVRIGKKKK